MKTVCVIFIYLHCILLKAETFSDENNSIQHSGLLHNGEGYIYPFPKECSEILKSFAEYASNFTMCSILHARPIRLCKKCIGHYVNFSKKYQDLMETVVNGTSCRSVFISCDRMDVVLEYHDNILAVWENGNCNDCYDWSSGTPELSNNTKRFDKMYNTTMDCIINNINPTSNNSEQVCEKCMQSYVQLDDYYKSLSPDAICMDVVDAMNTTRSIWSKSLNCCKLRRTPEIVFLCCTAIISVLPLLYYLSVRYCGPIRDLPNVLKQSRFKQTILSSVDRGNVNYEHKD